MRKNMIGALGMMAIAMGGMGMGMPEPPAPKRKEKKPTRPMTPEEIAAELEKRTEKFNNDVVKYNEHRRSVGKTKDFVINGITIASSSEKNAMKAFKKLLAHNGLAFTPANYTPIVNDEEYQNCLKRFEEVFQAIPGTAESAEADILSKRITEYEAKHFPMEEPSIENEV